MPAAKAKKQPARKPAAIDLDAELARIAAMNKNELRGLWREREAERSDGVALRRLALAIGELAGLRFDTFFVERGRSSIACRQCSQNAASRGR
jgi:hypothetical protein